MLYGTHHPIKKGALLCWRHIIVSKDKSPDRPPDQPTAWCRLSQPNHSN